MTKVNQGGGVQLPPTAKTEEEHPEQGHHPARGKVATTDPESRLSEHEKAQQPSLKLTDRSVDRVEPEEASSPKKARKKKVGFMDQVVPSKVHPIETREEQDQWLVEKAFDLASQGKKLELIELLFTELSNEQLSRAAEDKKTMSAETFFERLQSECSPDQLPLIKEVVLIAFGMLDAYGNEVFTTRNISQVDAQEKVDSFLRKIVQLTKANEGEGRVVQALVEKRRGLEGEYTEEALKSSETQDEVASRKAVIDNGIRASTNNKTVYKLLRQIEELELVIDDNRLESGPKNKAWTANRPGLRYQNLQLTLLSNLLESGADKEAEAFIKQQTSRTVVTAMFDALQDKKAAPQLLALLKSKLEQM